MRHALTLQKVNGRDPMPKYLQAQDILVAAIRSGKLPPGAKLPPTAEICELVDISLITAQKALEGLVHDGWLRREVGRGTFVRDDIDLSRRSAPPMSVGLLFPPHVNIDDYYHGTLINALRNHARSATRRIEFFFHERFEAPKRTSGELGLICVHPPLENQADVERIARRFPTVVLGGTLPGGRVSTVDCDNIGGARDAIRLLWHLNHRRFLVLSGPTNLTNARDRNAGAAAELAALGVTLDADHLLISRDSVVVDEETRGRLAALLTGIERPTAIVAGGFYLALAAIQVARQCGLTLPTDVSVIGFDDPPSTPLLDPPLTTVRQPLAAMAEQALRIVAEAGPPRDAKPVHLNLPTELVERRSTGPAPRAARPVR